MFSTGSGSPLVTRNQFRPLSADRNALLPQVPAKIYLLFMPIEYMFMKTSPLLTSSQCAPLSDERQTPPPPVPEKILVSFWARALTLNADMPVFIAYQ